MIGNTGAADDYCEIYRFPCCGKTVIVGDGPVSRHRCDGCCREETKDTEMSPKNE